MFALFEGVDTSGKTTQIEKLKSVNANIIATFEPGATKLGKEIRAILLEKEFKISFKAELLLFLADRAEHYEKIVAPNGNKLVISDRGFVSGIAYALANDKNLDISFLIELNRFALGGKMPDKIILLKTTKELLTSRISAKSHDKIEKRGIEYLLKVQENMEKVLQKAGVEYIILNAHESIENLHAQVKKFLKLTNKNIAMGVR
ncbi:MAG: dTMP kinase [Campylobacteraceae bacterium]|jgi:dTMP kinase|nr:dTMP kinase [Campylobacteraceae bacterium]